MGMLTYKLPLIVIVAHESCIVDRQIGVGKSKYWVFGEPLLTGHVTMPNSGPKSARKGLNNWDAHL